jgi:hypothetical protein
MKIKIKKTFGYWNCAQIFKPDYRNMTIKEIEKQEQKNLKTYFNVGYDIFLFNRNLSTIYILKTKN